MKKDKMVINRKGAIEKIYQGYAVVLNRAENGKIDWDIKEMGGDVHNCKTKVEAENVLIHLITCFEENENQYL
jgi:hypothetical protein